MLDLEGLDQYDLLEEYYGIYPDDFIYEITDDNLRGVFGDDLENFANRVLHGSYNARDTYFYMNGNGNITTLSEDEKEERGAGFIEDVIGPRL